MLRATGATIGMSGFTGLAAGNKNRSATEIFDQARSIRRKTGSQEDFNQYLKNHGFNVTQKQSKVSFPTQDGEVGTQNIQGKHLTTTLSLHWTPVSSDYDALADYHVEADVGEIFGAGGPPDDHVTVSWPSSDFDLVEDGTYEDNMPNGNLTYSSFNGADWRWKDEYACGYGCDHWFAVGCYLEPTDPSSPPRKVQATYQSAWNSDNASLSVSFGLDGSVTVTLSGSSDAEVQQIDRKVSEL